MNLNLLRRWNNENKSKRYWKTFASIISGLQIIPLCNSYFINYSSRIDCLFTHSDWSSGRQYYCGRTSQFCQFRNDFDANDYSGYCQYFGAVDVADHVSKNLLSNDTRFKAIGLGKNAQHAT